jgi:hypothetical protein
MRKVTYSGLLAYLGIALFAFFVFAPILQVVLFLIYNTITGKHVPL